MSWKHVLLVCIPQALFTVSQLDSAFGGPEVWPVSLQLPLELIEAQGASTNEWVQAQGKGTKYSSYFFK